MQAVQKKKKKKERSEIIKINYVKYSTPVSGNDLAKRETYGAHQNVSQCHQSRSQSRWAEPSGKYSTYLPDSSVLHHHSVEEVRSC